MKISEIKNSIEKILDHNKAKNIVTIDLKNKSYIADYMIIASGTSSRHLQSLSKNQSQFTKSDAGGPETIVSFNIENERDLQRIFDYFSRDVLLPDFYPEQRSIGRIKESIYRFFKEELKMSIEDDKFIDIVSINT